MRMSSHVGNVVAKTSNDKMPSGEGSGVDHAFNKTSPQDDPSSQIEPAGTAPAPVFAFTPEINRDDTPTDSDSGSLARRQESARVRGAKARNGRNRSSAASGYCRCKEAVDRTLASKFGDEVKNLGAGQHFEAFIY